MGMKNENRQHIYLFFLKRRRTDLVVHVGEEGEEMVKEGDRGGRAAEALGMGGGAKLLEERPLPADYSRHVWRHFSVFHSARLPLPPEILPTFFFFFGQDQVKVELLGSVQSKSLMVGWLRGYRTLAKVTNMEINNVTL